MSLCEFLREDMDLLPGLPSTPSTPAAIVRKLWEGPSCPLGLSFLLCFGVPRDSGLSLPFDRRRLVNLPSPPQPTPNLVLVVCNYFSEVPQ